MRYSLFFLAIVFSSVSVRAAESQVVATIKPLHSLVAAVMQDTGDQPLLLVDGKASPHTFSLKPSQVKALHRAKLVFYISENFEVFLRKPLALLPKSVHAPVEKMPGLTFYRVRSSEDFLSSDADEKERQGQSAEAMQDMHVWLRVDNAKAMVMEIARRLSIEFPENRSLYFNNARRLGERITKMRTSVEKQLAPLRGKPFVVFHDAIQYYEKEYGLQSIGSVVAHSEQGIGAKHMQELRKRIGESGAECIFQEPSFDSKVLDGLVQDTGIRLGMLDPEGALLEPGPELYFQLTEAMADAIESCLASKHPQT